MVAAFLSRQRGDPQPAEPIAVLLASTGHPFGEAAVRAAVTLAEGGPVAVLSVAHVYGSAFGLPNPGLMPTAKERKAQTDSVEWAVRRLRSTGVATDGQVAVTRGAVKTIARVAVLRGAGHVVLQVPPTPPRWRALVEGDPVAGVARRMRRRAELHVVEP